jgi:hypothetical protein
VEPEGCVEPGVAVEAGVAVGPEVVVEPDVHPSSNCFCFAASIAACSAATLSCRLETVSVALDWLLWALARLDESEFCFAWSR